VPTFFVGVHGAIVALVALFGLLFLLNPCGGGDLCLGGVVGVMALGVAGLGAIAIAIWQFRRRASPLFVLDCVLIAVLGSIALTMPGGPAALQVFALQLLVLLALLGAAIAGRAVIPHRIEAVVTLAILAALATQRDAGGIGVLIVGLVALALGWSLARTAPSSPPTAEPPPATS
jgi:hypothetical protein